MAKVMKSFRLSESAIAALENRDTQKYRSGQEYIEALLLNQEEKETSTMENLAEDVTELKQDIKQILQLLLFRLITLGQHIHQYTQLDYQEYSYLLHAQAHSKLPILHHCSMLALQLIHLTYLLVYFQ